MLRSAQATTQDLLDEILAERIMILDGSMGALIYALEPSDEQYRGMERIAPYVGYIAAAGYVIVIPIFLAIISGILLGVFNALLGGDASYKQVFAVVSHAGLITVLQTVFVMPLDYARETLSSPTTLGVFVPFLDEKSFLSRLLGTIDLFQIWWLVVLAIGLGVLYKRRTGPIASHRVEYLQKARGRAGTRHQRFRPLHRARSQLPSLRLSACGQPPRRALA